MNASPPSRQQISTFRAHGAAVAWAVLAASCAPSAVHDERPPLTAAAPVVQTSPPPPTAPATSTTPWTAMAGSTWIEERQGEPALMKLGERCRIYRQLPTLRFTASTLVQDACLELPSDTVVDVREGVTLVIVATNGLRVGRNVSFNARGVGGRRGARAPFASIRRDIQTAAELERVCVERGNQCACPSPADAGFDSIRGRAGEPGAAGGSIYVIAAELTSTSGLAGFSSDVSGGVGGPPGDSGTLVCARGDARCISPACSADASFGKSGAAGQVFLTLGGNAAAKSVTWIGDHTIPAGALTVVALESSLAQRGAELEANAVQQGWQRRAGRSLGP